MWTVVVQVDTGPECRLWWYRYRCRLVSGTGVDTGTNVDDCRLW